VRWGLSRRPLRTNRLRSDGPRCRVFLDANVLFSAAWREDAGLLRLWRRADARLITSPYAVDEAFRNLETTAQRERLFRLTASMELVPGAASGDLPDLPSGS
jgi:hypothetical protein